MARHGLELVKVEELSTHGRSYRYWIRKAGTTTADVALAPLVERELASGLLDPQSWREFQARSLAAARGLKAWLPPLSAAGPGLGYMPMIEAASAASSIYHRCATRGSRPTSTRSRWRPTPSPAPCADCTTRPNRTARRRRCGARRARCSTCSSTCAPALRTGA